MYDICGTYVGRTVIVKQWVGDPGDFLLSSGLWLPKLWYTQALIGQSCKKFTGEYIFAQWYNYRFTGVHIIFSKWYSYRGVYFSKISVPASDYPSSDTHKLSLDRVAKKLTGEYIFAHWYNFKFTGVHIFSKLYGYRGVYFSKISLLASDYPNSDTHKLSLDRVAKKFTGEYIFAQWYNYMFTGVHIFSKWYGYRGLYFSKISLLPLITQALIHTSSHWTELQKKFTGEYIFTHWYNYTFTGVHIFSKL